MQQVHRRTLRQQVVAAQARERALPKQILWVWERREDMRWVDARTTGLAVLAQTLRLGASVEVVPRRQGLYLPDGVQRLAVVRLEVVPGFARSAVLGPSVEAIAEVARRPGVAALQVDFDARRSERPFYRELLERLRARLPAGMPLEITALVSWCTTDRWMAGLPVNAAVPMYFRMEPDRRRAGGVPVWDVREPLCAGTVGVSTGEPWPARLGTERRYVFADRGWAQDRNAVPPLSTP